MRPRRRPTTWRDSDTCVVCGGSDAILTADVAVPSLDGLGSIGGNDRTPIECIRKSSIVPRTMLPVALLRSVGGGRSLLVNG